MLFVSSWFNPPSGRSQPARHPQPSRVVSPTTLTIPPSYEDLTVSPSGPTSNEDAPIGCDTSGLLPRSGLLRRAKSRLRRSHSRLRNFENARQDRVEVVVTCSGQAAYEGVSAAGPFTPITTCEARVGRLVAGDGSRDRAVVPLATTSRRPMGAWHRECCLSGSWGLEDFRCLAPLQPGCFLPEFGPLPQLAGRPRKGARHREPPRPW